MRSVTARYAGRPTGVLRSYLCRAIESTGTMTRERVSVEMPHHLIAELEDAAEERDATRNQVAVHWLGRWLDGRP